MFDCPRRVSKLVITKRKEPQLMYVHNNAQQCCSSFLLLITQTVETRGIHPKLCFMDISRKILKGKTNLPRQYIFQSLHEFIPQGANQKSKA